MLKKTVVLMAISLIIFAGCKKSVMLEYKPSGEEIKYKFIMDNKVSTEGKVPREAEMFLNMLNMTMDMDISQKVSSDKDNILNEIIIEEGKIKNSAGEQNFPEKGKKITIKMKKNGEVLETSENKIELGSQTVFPDKPVSQGDKWPAKIKLPPDLTGGNETLEGNYILEKFETVNGRDCGIINLEIPSKTFKSSDKTTTINMKGNICFDYNKGQLVNSHIENNIDITKANTDNKLIINQIVDIKTK